MTTTSSRAGQADLRGDFSGFANLKAEHPTPEGRQVFRLTSGQIDEDAQAFFGRGFCHWFAAAMHSVTGWDLITVDARTTTAGWQPAHTAVVTPAGTLLDVFGEHSAEDLRRRYLNADQPETRLRQVESANMPGDVLVAIDHLRGDPLWWTAVFSGQDKGMVLHFARLLLRHHGYGDHIHASALERTKSAGGSPPKTPSSTNTSPAGGKETGMSNVDEVRAALSLSTGRAEGVRGLLAQAQQELSEVVAGVTQAASGSGDAEIQQAIGLYAEAGTQIEQIGSMVARALGSVSGYVARL
uniref:hypothetical protein n=1 Tax=Amycolatopsis sp. CA-293810 TaxID=3239926 RepID=UPI003F491721